MSSGTKIYTPKVGLFLNTTPSSSATWKRVGKGATKLNLDYGAQTTTEQYIDENSATTSTDSYQVASDQELTCFAGEPIFEFIDNIRRNRYTGSDAETQALIVYLYKSSPYISELNSVSIAIKSFGGDAGKPVSITYTLSFNGDPTTGTTVVTNGVPVFTAASVSPITMTASPADEATGVSRSSAITITFNNQVKTENVTVTTAAGNPVSVNRSWDSSGKVLTITPTATMTASTVHLVVVAGVQDIYGQSFATAVVNFTTGT